MPGNHHKINYIEFHSTDIAQTKKFYTAVFGWSFVRLWVRTTSASTARASTGASSRTKPHEAPANSRRLSCFTPPTWTPRKIAVRMEGGGIIVPTFEFPGGRRFHFSDGAGNVLGVWSE